MGNCLMPQSSTKIAAASDAEDDWSWSSASSSTEDDEEATFATKKNGGGGGGGRDSGKITEVKIKITKKQLERLLGKMEVKEMRVDQVLAKLMNHDGSGYEIHQHHRSWKPALQSIPEVN